MAAERGCCDWYVAGDAKARRWWWRAEVVAVLVAAAAGFAPAFSGVKVVTEQWRHCCSGVVVGEVGAAAAAMVVKGEKKIRVRVLGDEDDDVATFHWTAC